MRRCAIAFVLAAAAPAAADNSSLHATASGNVAATDNVFSVPASDSPQADIFTQVRPGLLFAYDAPRMIHELTAQAELLEYALHSDKPSVTFRGGWSGLFLPGPRSELLLSANGSTGQMNALTTRSSADSGSIGIVPVSTQPIDTHQADASEYVSWVASKDTRLSQTAIARYTTTDDNLSPPTKTKAAEVGGSIGYELDLRSNSFSVEAGGSYVRLDRVAPLGSMPGSTLQRQLNPKGTLSWRHDFDKHWSSSLDGGLIYLNPIAGDPYNPGIPLHGGPLPIFGAMVAYTEVWGRATVSARRAVTPNLFIALDTVDDSLIGQVALPLPWLDDNPHARTPKLVALGTLGIERAQLIDPTQNNMINGSFEIGRLDVGLAWTPRAGQTYGVRYEFIYQHGDSSSVMSIASFFRDTLFFTFDFRYPERMAAQVPRRTQSVRADRKDLAPVGAEPVIPDPTEQFNGDEEGGGGGER